MMSFALGYFSRCFMNCASSSSFSDLSLWAMVWASFVTLFSKFFDFSRPRSSRQPLFWSFPMAFPRVWLSPSLSRRSSFIWKARPIFSQ